MDAHLFLLVAATLFMVSCNDAGTGPTLGTGFAVYSLQDTAMSAAAAMQHPLSELVLASTPLFTSADLVEYRWLTHSLVPAPPLDALLKQMQFSRGNLWGQPFVVVARGERISLGAFWWAYSSLAPPVPFIELMVAGPYVIANPPLSSFDPRSDPRIFAALVMSGVLVDE